MLIKSLLFLSVVLPGFVNYAQAANLSTDAKPIEKHEQGREIYNYRCYYCHGYSGDAKTLASRSLSPAPRDFTNSSLVELTKEKMIQTVVEGRVGTGMTSFTQFLTPSDIELVVDFIRHEFMENTRENTRYHTVENGWPEHEKYQIAFPFATGELALDMDQALLTEQQRLGLQLYLSTCISCHDNSRVDEPGAIWQTQSISYPRNNYSYTNFDGVTGASTYQKHDTFALIESGSEQEKIGEQLFRNNCAFCHALDGSGKNWIGSFLAQKPQDLQDKTFMANVDRVTLKQMIKKGKINTSMPAWENVLSDQDIDNIVSYISIAFHYVKE